MSGVTVCACARVPVCAELRGRCRCLALCFSALFPLDRVSSEPAASLEDRMPQWSSSVFHTMTFIWVLETRIRFMQALLAVTLSHCPSPGLNLFTGQWSAVKYIHTAVKQSCRTFLSYTPETHTLKNLCLSPANLLSLLCHLTGTIKIFLFFGRLF